MTEQAQNLQTAPQPKSPTFQFVGGALCLDFCNTMGGHREGIPREKLNSIEDFIAWSEQAGLIDRPEAELLRRKASKEKYATGDAQRATRDTQPSSVLRDASDKGGTHPVLTRAIRLREALYRIFRAAGKGKSPQENDLAILNSELEASLSRLRVGKEKGDKGFEWQWGDAALRLENPLGPIARSAAELMTHEYALDQVGQCHGDNCGWLFVDLSKNHSRRWCDMRDCGNRAKVRRFRAKA